MVSGRHIYSHVCSLHGNLHAHFHVIFSYILCKEVQETYKTEGVKEEQSRTTTPIGLVQNGCWYSTTHFDPLSKGLGTCHMIRNINLSYFT